MQTLFVLADHAHHGDHHWFFPLVPLLWTALIIGAIYLFTRRRWRGNGMHSARRVLAERFASGEITAEEYRQRLSQLG